MKHWLLIVLALGLAACGNETANQDVAPAAETAEESTVDDAAAAADAAVEEATSNEETLQVVEESAAADQPTPEDEAIVLATADTSSVDRNWEFEEGTHYARITPSQPTWGGADKIEVAEFFWYGCPHCLDFEPYLNRWKAQKDPGVRFVKVPAMWNPLLELHARMFFVEEILVRNGDISDGDAFRQGVFAEYHRRGNRMTSEDQIFRLFERAGVSRKTFDDTWESFEVDQNMRKARDLARRYGVSSVPTVVVNGKFITDATARRAGGYVELIRVIDELTVREGL